MTSRNVLVTGASGLVGKRLIDTLESKGHNVRKLVRRAPRDAMIRNTLVMSYAVVGWLAGTAGFAVLIAFVATAIMLPSRVTFASAGLVMTR